LALFKEKEMSDDQSRPRCQALTRAGNPCKNYAQEGSPYCGVHVQLAAETATAVPTAAAVPPPPDPEPIPVVEEQIPIEEDVPSRELRHQLMQELDNMIERLQALNPGYAPPPFSPEKMLTMLNENVEKLSPGLGLGILKKLRGAVNEELFDIETWKGMWFMLNYTLEHQADMVKRRFTGEYETDEWGLDWEFIEAVRPFFDFMYNVYWRVQTSGIENIPDYGRALLVSNHSGQLPWDGAMVGMAVLNEHPGQRLVRNLYANWFPTLPFFSAIFVKMGQAMATVENGTRLLEQDELVGVYPEGYKGVGKLFKDRYKLARFGRGGFVKMALNTQAPIIPVAVVGAEETYISLGKSNLLARLTGMPFFPISPTWPWLGPIGFIPLPTKWYIDFGPPISTAEYGPDAVNNMVLVSKLSDQVRTIVQEMINDRLAQRRSIFY